jgi:hypothetical protein
MTGKKITLSAAMRARDVSRPVTEHPEQANAVPQAPVAQPGSAAQDAGGEPARRGEPASQPGDAVVGSARYGENWLLRRKAPRGAASVSERAQARILGGAGMEAAGAPEAKREGLSQAQPDDTAPSPSKQGVRGIGVYPPEENSADPPVSKRTRHRKRRTR